ncbi:MAG: translation elongation factor Ts [Eubacteriales bacterium]
MATITASMVSELRKKTGLGMMDCKKALVEAEGDMDQAVKILREKGLATAAKKEGRIAAEGLVDIASENGITAIIEVNTETDFVAKNASFREFVKGLLATLVATKPATMEEFLNTPYNGTADTVSTALVGQIAVIGEKISIRRFNIVEGTVSTYIHGNGTTGVIVKFDTDATLENPAFAEYAKNIALQIAAGNPPKYVNESEVPQAEIDEEKAILIQQAKNDPKNANKPDAILEKMVGGRLGKFYERVCLVKQAYVKDDKMNVGQYTESVAKELGVSIKINSFVIFEKGEGLQKREENFAEEIAKMVQG